MKNNGLKRYFIISVIFTVVFLQSALTVFAGETDSMADYYGRSMLEKLPDSKALLYAYDNIASGIEKSLDSIDVYNEKDPLTAEQLQMVIDAYIRDYAHHFWFNGAYRYSYNSTSILEIKPQYTMSGSQLEKAKSSLESKVQEFLKYVDSSSSDFETELILHDRLAEHIEYRITENCHNIYGALIEGVAVCDGYTKALQYLLQRCGIQSFTAIGSSVNPSTDVAEGHAWNYVLIDGKYYHTDLTWDDQGERLFHMYLNQSDSVIKNDHYIEPAEYTLPVCNSTDSQYFTVTPGKLKSGSYSADEVASYLKANSLEYSFYIPGDRNGFITWMTENIQKIAGKAGVYGGFSYSYAYIGDEVQLKIVQKLCLHLTMTLVEKQEPTCTKDGMEAYYRCICGKSFKDKIAIREIEDLNSLIIPALGHNYTEKIEDTAHKRASASTCLEYDTYWYDCSRCDSNSKNDSSAKDKYYNSDQTGQHLFKSKTEAESYFVIGSGADCQHAKQYYYKCEYCDKAGNNTWASDTYGSHDVSDTLFFDNGYHFKKCMISGCSYTEDREKCSGGASSCIEKAVCDICKHEYGELGNHLISDDWYYDNGYHFKKCTISGCNYTEGRGKCSGGASSCIEKAICNVCKHEYGGFGDHAPSNDFTSDDEYHYTICKNCSLTMEKEEHTDNDGNYNCDKCGYLMPVIPVPTPTPTPTVVPTPTPTVVPTPTPTVVPTPTPTVVPTPTPTVVPTPTPTVVPTPTPTVVPDPSHTSAPSVDTVPNTTETIAPDVSNNFTVIAISACGVLVLFAIIIIAIKKTKK